MNTNETYWLTGLPCSGKTTIGTVLASKLRDLGYPVVHLDGDDVRDRLCSDLGFAPDDRKENLRRVAHVCDICNDNDVIVIASFVSPTDEIRLVVEDVVDRLNVIHV